MDLRHRIKIEKNFDTITKDLKVSDVKCILIEKRVISLEDCVLIEENVLENEQAFKLLQKVLRCGTDAYDIFKNSLMGLYDHLVTALDDTKVTAQDLADYEYLEAVRRNIVNLSHTLSYEKITMHMLQEDLISHRQMQDWDALNVGSISKVEKVLKDVLTDKTKAAKFIKLCNLEHLLQKGVTDSYVEEESMEVSQTASGDLSDKPCSGQDELQQNETVSTVNMPKEKEVKSANNCNSSLLLTQSGTVTTSNNRNICEVTNSPMSRKTTSRLVLANVEDKIEYEICPEVVVINRNSTLLITQIDPSLMCPFLQCLTPEDRECITARNSYDGPYRATIDLLSRLVRKKNFWDDFLCTLKHELIGLEHVSEILEKDMRKYLEEKEYEKNITDVKSLDSPITPNDAANKYERKPTTLMRKIFDETSEERPEDCKRSTITHKEGFSSEAISWKTTSRLANMEDEIEYELCPEVDVIQRNTKWLILLIDPSLMCPFLQCLTAEDRGYIAATNSKLGPMRATVDLLSRLVRRNNFWDDFLCALKHENIGLEHVSERLEKDMREYLKEKGCEKNIIDV